MSYYVLKEERSYTVVESETELHIYKSRSQREARNMCRSLNLGAGFDGFTPTFFALANKKGDSEESPF